MKLISFIALNLVMFGSNTYARSGGAGNGGDAIVCPDKVMLLDSYEAHKMRLNIDLSNPNVGKNSWRTMVNVAVRRLEKFDENTSSKLYDYAMEMVNDFEKFQMFPDARGKHVYLGKDVIAEINDSEHVSTPEGCEEHPRQMVSQRVPKFKYEYRYEFSKSLWDKMTLQDQAMTILHEAWYRIMLENGAKNSRATRYINGLVSSKEFESFTFNEYLGELRATELKKYVIMNKSQSIKDKKILINLKSNNLVINNEACISNIKMNLSIKESFRLFNRKQKYVKNLPLKKMCFKNSKITKIQLPSKIIKEKYTLRLDFFQIVFGSRASDDAIIHYKNGKLSHFSGIKLKKLIQMYYICNGEESYSQNIGCKEGPFNNRDTAVSSPTKIKFDLKERVNSHFKPE